MRKILEFSMLVMMFIFVAEASAGENGYLRHKVQISIVGLDKERKPTAVQVSSQEYVRHLKEIITSFHESAEPVLIARVPKKGWMLRTFVAGVGIGFEAGVGPILSVSASPRVKILYSNREDIIIP